jgi:TonB family protein
MKRAAAALAFAIPAICHAQATPPKLLSIDEAVYPAEQLLPGIEATVMLRTTVTPLGAAENAVVAESSGFPPLDQAALDVVKTAKFKPQADKDGKPVAVTVKLPISFAFSPSILERPCKGLNNEITEFRRFNPTLPVSDFKNVAVMNGALISGFLAHNRAGSTTDRVLGLKKVSEEIQAQCSAQPDRVVLDVIRETTKKHNY